MGLLVFIFSTITIPEEVSMKMIYKRSSDQVIEYDLKTDPPDAKFWTTYKLKKRDIVLVDKFDRTETSIIKDEILNDIVESEKPQEVETGFAWTNKVRR